MEMGHDLTMDSAKAKLAQQLEQGDSVLTPDVSSSKGVERQGELPSNLTAAKKRHARIPSTLSAVAAPSGRSCVRAEALLFVLVVHFIMGTGAWEASASLACRLMPPDGCLAWHINEVFVSSSCISCCFRGRDGRALTGRCVCCSEMRRRSRRAYLLEHSGGVPEPYRLRAVAHSLGGASLLVYAVMCRRLGRPHHLYRIILLTPAGFLEKIPLVRPRPLRASLHYQAIITASLMSWLRFCRPTADQRACCLLNGP